MSSTLLRAPRPRGLAKTDRGESHFNLLHVDPMPLTMAIGLDGTAVHAPQATTARLSTSSTGAALGVHLVTLGELRCIHNGVDTDLPKQKLRFALLVYLAMERSAPRDKVLALLWPEVDEERARGRLKTTVFELRQAFGNNCIETRGSEIRVADDVTLDARDFGTLADVGDYVRALELYQRPFLDGYYVDGADEFERWSERKRSVLGRTYPHIARAAINQLIGQQEFGDALKYATLFVEVDEISEDAHRLRMLALTALGRHAEALADFEAWERNLREQAGILPSQAVRALVDEIRSNAATAPVAWPFDRSGEKVTEQASAPQRVAEAWSVGRRVGVALGILAMLATVAAVTNYFAARTAFEPGMTIDTTRFAALPFFHPDASVPLLNEQQLLRDGLARFEDISIAETWQMESALAQQRSGKVELNKRIALDVAIRAARRVGAGRLFIGETVPVRDSLRVQVTLYDTRARKPINLGTRSRRVARSGIGIDNTINRLVDELLFGKTDPKAEAAVSGGTSFAAVAAFARAQSAIGRWDLPAAEAAFLDATRADVSYVQAALWLAQTRMWRGKDPEQWRVFAQMAARQTTRLSSRDASLTQALLALADGDRPVACGLYRKLTVLEPSDFPTWYSYGHCLATDSIVIPDNSSPTRWRFRSGYGSAVDAFRTAFHLAPSVHSGFANDLFEQLQRLLKTGENDRREGHALFADSTRFMGVLYWSHAGDSLAVLPVPVDENASGKGFPIPPTRDEAIRRQRALFLSIARSWREDFPASSDVLVAVAIGLDLNGDVSAADTLAAARSLASTAEQREFLSANEVLLRLKYAVPNDERGLKRAMALADTLLHQATPAVTKWPKLLAAIAALRGQARLATEYLDKAVTVPGPSQVVSLQNRLSIYASFGGPKDSIIALAQAIGGELPKLQPTALSAARGTLTRASAMAFSKLHVDLSPEQSGKRYFIEAQKASLRGDTAQVRAVLNGVASSRRPEAKLRPDGMVVDASLWLEIGDVATAARWLDRSLNELSSLPLRDFTDAVQTSALVRVMLLRSDVAKRQGDLKSARLWREPVQLLLEKADPFVTDQLKQAKPR